MASVYFDPSSGGDGTTVSDDSNPVTGLAQGGHRTRFVPALGQLVAIANHVISQIGAALSAATSATSSATSASASAATASAAATAATGAVGAVKVSGADTTAAVLNSKLAVTGSLTKTVLNPGANEQIQLGVTVAYPVTSVAGKTGAVTLSNGDVGLPSVEDKSSATIRAELTAGNVTGALGYTPQNAATAWNTGNFNPATKSDTGHTHSGYLSADMGHANIGSLVFALKTTVGAVSPGATVAGSALVPSDANNTISGSSLSGTWRCLGYDGNGGSTNATLYQRIS